VPTAEYFLNNSSTRSIQPGRDEDGRTQVDLAADLGFSVTTLASLSHSDPQRAALRVFNVAYPTNYDKESLINVGNLVAIRPQFLSDLLGE